MQNISLLSRSAFLSILVVCTACERGADTVVSTAPSDATNLVLQDEPVGAERRFDVVPAHEEEASQDEPSSAEPVEKRDAELSEDAIGAKDPLDWSVMVPRRKTAS